MLQPAGVCPPPAGWPALREGCCEGGAASLSPAASPWMANTVHTQSPMQASQAQPSSAHCPPSLSPPPRVCTWTFPIQPPWPTHPCLLHHALDQQTVAQGDEIADAGCLQAGERQGQKGSGEGDDECPAAIPSTSSHSMQAALSSREQAAAAHHCATVRGHGAVCWRAGARKFEEQAPQRMPRSPTFGSFSRLPHRLFLFLSPSIATPPISDIYCNRSGCQQASPYHPSASKAVHLCSALPLPPERRLSNNLAPFLFTQAQVGLCCFPAQELLLKHPSYPSIISEKAGF